MTSKELLTVVLLISFNIVSGSLLDLLTTVINIKDVSARNSKLSSGSSTKEKSGVYTEAAIAADAAPCAKFGV